MFTDMFGNDCHKNMIHCGTIFFDAGSKCTHVEDQVTLGTGKTVNEEWGLKSGFGNKIASLFNIITLKMEFYCKSVL